jgi:hypothetical protein
VWTAEFCTLPPVSVATLRGGTSGTLLKDCSNGTPPSRESSPAALAAGLFGLFALRHFANLTKKQKNRQKVLNKFNKLKLLCANSNSNVGSTKESKTWELINCALRTL